MESSVESDPALAIGTAKELVETCCKTILSDLRIEADKDWTLSKLVKETELPPIVRTPTLRGRGVPLERSPHASAPSTGVPPPGRGAGP